MSKTKKKSLPKKKIVAKKKVSPKPQLKEKEVGGMVDDNRGGITHKGKPS